MAKLKKKHGDKDTYKGNYPSVFRKIFEDDVNNTTFQTHKKFTVTSGSSTSTCLPLNAIYEESLPLLGTNLTYNDADNIDGSLQSIIYRSINHLYYKRKNEPSKVFGPTNLNYIKKSLYESASVFTFPQNKVGEGIKPSTFELTGSQYNLKSDIYGNVYNVSIDTSSFNTNYTLYEGFNEYFDTSRESYVDSSGIIYLDGFPTTDGFEYPVGKRAHFNGSAFIRQSLPGYYDRDNNYAISFYISGSNTTTENQLIIGKLSDPADTQYPFKVELSGSNQIVFSAAAASNLIAQVTSSYEVSSSINHIICQKSGSSLEIFINSSSEASAQFDFLQSNSGFLSASGLIHNDSDVYIGGLSPNTLNLQGDLDEIRILNTETNEALRRSLSDRTEAGGWLQTNIVGNVFGKHGTVVISSPERIYNNLINDNYTASYRSTVTLNEFETIVRIPAGDFNMSLNPSLHKDNGVDFKNFVSGSDFGPYITTIGLYNEDGQLLAVGKLASPIRKRTDIDTNIVLRMDLDI